MAAGVLACGLVAVACLFSFTIRTNMTNRQTAIAATLLYDKMEQFRSTSFNDAIWAVATGTETLLVDRDRFLVTWEIDGNVPRTLTVIVYTEAHAWTRRKTELIRATTLVSPTF